MELSGRGSWVLGGSGQNERAVRNRGTLFLFPWDLCPQTVLTTALLSPGLWRLSLGFPCTWAQHGCCPAHLQAQSPISSLVGGRVGLAQLGLGVTPSSGHSARGVQATWDRHSA